MGESGKKGLSGMETISINGEQYVKVSDVEKAAWEDGDGNGYGCGYNCIDGNGDGDGYGLQAVALAETRCER